MTKVLVTGAAGFIGRHAVPALLDRGFEVHAVSSRPVAGGEAQVAWHQADLFDVVQTRRLVSEVRASHLLHLAWITEPDIYWSSPENLRWVRASLDLFRTFSENGGRRAVMAGSCAEYAACAGSCSEATTPCSPATIYGLCKHAAGLLGEACARHGGLSWASGRVFQVYGPHERPERLVPSVIVSLLRGEPAVIRNPKQARDFLHVSDVANAFAALLQSPVSGAVNIASGTPVLLEDLARTIATVVRRPELIRLVPAPGAIAEPAALLADVGRLSGEVGWRPRYDLERGMERTVEWWKRRHGEGDRREAR